MSKINKLLKLTAALFILGMLTVAITYLSIRNDLPSVDTLKDIQLQTPLRIFSAEGLLMSQYGEKRRIPLELSQIPQQLINAVLDTEDSRFYQHPGIDIIGIVRAATNMIFTSGRSQGASTITQQVARNFYLTNERTLLRKIKELFIALNIESELSKDEILTLYLNKIELGHRAFGVGAAAQVYYGKEIQQLTLAEMATIAGLPKAPSTTNPITNPTKAKARRAVVLGRMLAMGHITQAEYQQASDAPVTAQRHGADIQADAPYVASLANDEMVTRFGLEDAYTKGYQVFTTVGAKLQSAAQQAVIHNLHAYDERHGYRGPNKQLWKPDQDQAWSTKQIHEYLSTEADYDQLVPAVVIATLELNATTEQKTAAEQNATVQLKNGQIIELNWTGLKWASPYINDKKQGRSPKTVTDIFTPGALIWVRFNKAGQSRLAQIPTASGALVALDPANGAIRSVVGGYSYTLSQYNRATQAKRQVGSNIKPFIYSAALDNGYTLASLINDAPIHQWDEELGVAWRPQNSPPLYDGPTRIRVALAKSKNVVSVRLFKGVGQSKVIDHITKFGIPREELPPNDSLALGSASLSPLQVATGIATFANGGFLIEPYLIEKILDANDNVIYQADPLIACPQCAEQNQTSSKKAEPTDNDNNPLALVPPRLAPRVINPQNAFLVSQAMTSTIWGGGSWNHGTGWNGTGWRAQKFHRHDLSGKTGTSNDARDTWFSGFNNKLMATTWVGFDDPSRMLGSSATGSEAGAKTALPAWIEFMTTALTDIEMQPLVIPANIISVRIDTKTGLLSTKNDHTSRFEYFISGTEPTRYATESTIPEVIDNDGNGKVSDDEELF